MRLISVVVFEDQSIFPLVTIAFILVNFSFNYVLMFLGEN